MVAGTAPPSLFSVSNWRLHEVTCLCLLSNGADCLSGQSPPICYYQHRERGRAHQKVRETRLTVYLMAREVPISLTSISTYIHLLLIPSSHRIQISSQWFPPSLKKQDNATFRSAEKLQPKTYLYSTPLETCSPWHNKLQNTATVTHTIIHNNKNVL